MQFEVGQRYVIASLEDGASFYGLQVGTEFSVSVVDNAGAAWLTGEQLAEVQSSMEEPWRDSADYEMICIAFPSELEGGYLKAVA